jgi:hypothetical protein
MADLRTQFVSQGTSMGKAMSIAGMVVAGLIAFIFAFDLALKFPFNRENPPMDIGMIVCAAILGYLSWHALRDAG